jgi:hypothetical protein
MSFDAFPISLADEPVLSMLCENSLTDAQVKAAQAALHDLDPGWVLDCSESCEADLFLDLSSVRPDGRVVSFIIHAGDGAIHVLRMVDDDQTRLGSFADMAQALRVVADAIKPGSRWS